MKRLTLALSLLLALMWAGSIASAQKVTLSYWQGWLAPEHIETEKRIVEEFIRLNPDIEVEFLHMNKPVQQVKVAFAAGTLGDVLVSSRDDFPNWQSLGIYMDLSPFLEREPDFAEAFVPQLMELFRVDGKQFGLPFSANGRGLTYYNADAFAASGVADPGLDPWSWDELVSNGKKLVRREGAEITQAAIDIQVHPMNLWTWFWANDTDLFNEDYTRVTINNPKVIETLNFMKELIEVERIMRPPAESEPAVIGSGAGPWFFVPWQQEYEQGGPQTKIMWNSYNGAEKRVAMIGGSGLQINAATEHPEEAWRLLRYLTSKEVQWERFLHGYGTSSLTENLVRASQMTDIPIPEPQALYWEVFSEGQIQPSFVDYRAWAKIFSPYVEQALNGEISVEEAVVHIENESRALMNL